jgi:predicted HTH domain antitoxin
MVYNQQYLKLIVKELNAGKISLRKIAKLNDVSLSTVQKVKGYLNLGDSL